jgi:hypothetical protein
MAEDYIAFCEELWRDWLDDRVAASLLPRVFRLDAAPEPYVSFSAGAKPLVALTTNPGRTMPHQYRASVQAGTDVLCKKDKYAESAPKLGRCYIEKLARRPAGRRIEKLRKLSSVLGYDGLLEVEACPFHSTSLPGKNALLQEISKYELLGRYAEHLRKFLLGRPVVSIQAVSTKASLVPEMPNSPWLAWVADILGLDPSAEFVSLVNKGSKCTAAAWVSRNGTRSALVLMMGSNNLPSDEGLQILAEEIRTFWRLESPAIGAQPLA